MRPTVNEATMPAGRAPRGQSATLRVGFTESASWHGVVPEVGVGFVNENARWRRPEGVVALPVIDLKLPLPLPLVWRKDNSSPLLAKFVADVRLLPEVQGFAKGKAGTGIRAER